MHDMTKSTKTFSANIVDGDASFITVQYNHQKRKEFHKEGRFSRSASTFQTGLSYFTHQLLKRAIRWSQFLFAV